MNDCPDDILNLRRSARYSVDRPDAVIVQLRYRLHETVEVLDAQLADISAYGMKLRTSVAVPLKETVQVQLSLTSGAVDVSLDGEVCWARPKDEKYWWLGISLVAPISDEILDQMAAYEIVDRRRDRRLRVAADAKARFELESETFDVKVLDLSQGGFSLLAPKTGQVGDRLLLIVNPNQLSSAPVLGRICWTRDEGERHVYGCEFITSSAAATVRAGLAHRSGELEPPDDHPDGPLFTSRRTLALVAGIACVAMLVCLQVGDMAGVMVSHDTHFPVGAWQAPTSVEPEPIETVAAQDRLEPEISSTTSCEQLPPPSDPERPADLEHPLIPVLRMCIEHWPCWSP